MTSAIVRTNPTSGSATTSSVRDNFGFAADEINRFLRASTDKAVTSGIDVITVSYADVPTFQYLDGIRILIEIADGGTTTVTNPTLGVNLLGQKPVKKFDGSSLAIGDLVAGGYYELVYDSQENDSPAGTGIWKVLSSTPARSFYEVMLGAVYPVGAILTTTRSEDPGSEGYFFAEESFGTWEAYAEGRVIAGIKADVDLDQSTAILGLNIGGISRVTWTTQTDHGLSLGDYIEVSGVPFTTTDINGNYVVRKVNSSTSFEYDKIGDAETYTGDADSLLALKNFNTLNEESGTEYNLDEQSTVRDHSHRMTTFFANDPIIGGGENFRVATLSNAATRGFDAAGNHIDIGTGRGDFANYGDESLFTDTSITNEAAADTAGDTTINDFTHNVQPTVATYIWTRTA